MLPYKMCSNTLAFPNRIRLWLGFLLWYNYLMIRTKNFLLGSTAVELTIEDEINKPCTIVISNNSSNQHILVGNSNVSTTNYGFKLEHDSDPIVLDLQPWDRLWAVGSNSSVDASIMIIERN